MQSKRRLFLVAEISNEPNFTVSRWYYEWLRDILGHAILYRYYKNSREKRFTNIHRTFVHPQQLEIYGSSPPSAAPSHTPSPPPPHPSTTLFPQPSLLFPTNPSSIPTHSNILPAPAPRRTLPKSVHNPTASLPDPSWMISPSLDSGGSAGRGCHRYSHIERRRQENRR